MRMFNRTQISAMSKLSGSLTSPSGTFGYLKITPGVFWMGNPTTPSSGYVKSRVNDISGWQAGSAPDALFQSCYAQITHNTIPYRNQWMTGAPISPTFMYVPCAQEKYAEVSAALAAYLVVQQTTAGTNTQGTGPQIDSGLGITFTLRLNAWGGATTASATTWMYAIHN